MIDLIEIDEVSFEIDYINKLIVDKKEFEKCKKKYKNCFYSILMRSITHESFDENEARNIFNNILKHLEELNTTLNRDVGIVVASIDYLSNIKNIMEEPKIIEEEKSDFVTLSSTKDELTGLYLRDVFDVYLDKSVSEALRRKEKLCFMMIDIDDFKKVNDTYGHQKGDEVLSTIGKELNNLIRKMDFAARYGGEELCVLMPNTDVNNASKIAERIRKSIAKIDFVGFQITISIGISELNKDIDSSFKLVKDADKLLYQAKNTGKNKVCTFL